MDFKFLIIITIIFLIIFIVKDRKIKNDIEKEFSKILASIEEEINKGIGYEVLEEYECKLLVQILPQQEQEKVITDFSLYDTYGLVGLQIFETKDNLEELTDEDDIISLFPNAVVSLIKDISAPDEEAFWIWEVIE